MTNNEIFNPTEAYRLGQWRIDPGTCQLHNGEQTERVEPRAMAVLGYLAAHHGRTVARDELLDEIWKTRHVVDEALTKCISQLRQVLHDDPRKPVYIQTVPKLGYRLLVAPAAIATEPAPPANVNESVEAPPAGAVDPTRASSGVESRIPSGPISKGVRRLWLYVLAALMLLLIYGQRERLLGFVTRQPVRLSVTLPAQTGLVEFTAAPMALTDNGANLILALADHNGSRLWRRRLDSGEMAPIAGTEGATSPFLSPDGQWIAFAANGHIERINIGGGEVQTIADAEQFFGGCWLDEQTLVFAPRFAGGLWRVPASGGKPRLLAAPSGTDTAYIWPVCLPGGRTVLFSQWRGGSQVDQSAIGFVAVDRGEQGILLEGAYHPRYLATGHLLFARVGTLMAVPFDVESRKIHGSPRQLLNGMLANVNSQVAFYETSNTQHLAFVQGRYVQPERRLLWVGRDGHVEQASALRQPFSSPRIAPDGKNIVTWLQDDKVGVWLLDVSRDRLVRLSRGIDDHSPTWSPDGKRIAFDSSRSGHYQLFVAAADSPGGEQQLTRDAHDHFVNAWLPDGRLAFTQYASETGSDVWLMEPRADATPEPLLQSPFSESEPAFSSDGHWFAFVSDESGRQEVYMQRFPATGPRMQVSRHGGQEPLWSRMSNELYFRQGQQVFAVQVSDGPVPSVSEPQALFAGAFHYNLYPTNTYDVAAGGRFLMVEEPAPTPPAVHVVLFTQRLLRDKSANLQ